MTPDDKEIRSVQKKMQDCISRLTRLAPLVGMARQVKDFSSDQRKNLLAEMMIEYIHRGDSVASAEVSARSSAKYKEKFMALEVAYAEACGTIAENEAVYARLEAARSIHAMLKETVHVFEG